MFANLREDFRTHEFHDNIDGFGGGPINHLAIDGRILNYTFNTTGQISGYAMNVRITNNTNAVNGPWAGGANMHGEDRLVPRVGADRRFAVRFHLHPSVKAARSADKRAVILTLPSGNTWRFGSDAELDLTDGVYLGTGDAIRKSQQIVVLGSVSAEPATVKWALKKATNASVETPVN